MHRPTCWRNAAGRLNCSSRPLSCRAWWKTFAIPHCTTHGADWRNLQSIQSCGARCFEVNSGKEIDLIISGAETELDKSVVEKIGDPLMHLVRNSMDHGIELGSVREARGKPCVARSSSMLIMTRAVSSSRSSMTAMACRETHPGKSD